MSNAFTVNDLVEQQSIEETGVRVPVPGGEAIVASGGSPAFLAKQRKLEKRYRKINALNDDQPIPDEDAEQIWREAMCGPVVKMWWGMPFSLSEFTKLMDTLPQSKRFSPPPVLPEGGEGNLPWAEGNCLWMLNHSRKFRSSVMKFSLNEDTYDRKNLEITEGN